jgi:hypothetical protein
MRRRRRGLDPRHAVGAALAFVVLVLSGCGGCGGDLCADVTCADGEECQLGECVVIDPGNGEHDECERDADCAEIQGRNRCDVAASRCVECLVASHCSNPERQICDPVDRFCVPRPPCEADDDCSDLPGAPRCEVDSGLCVACLTDDHCAGRQQRCHQSSGTCRFEACTTAADCAEYPDAPHCHTGSGLCQECTTDGHCADDELCRDGLCQPRGECQRDSECGVAERCNTLTQRCVQCVNSLDCRLGGRCLSSQCGPATACTGDADCGAPLRCAVSSGTCVDCTSDTHCASGQICEAGACTSPESCGAGSFCAPGEACASGACELSDCEDDGLGAGTVPYSALAMAPGEVPGIRLCPNTWRWFVVDAALGDGLLVDLAYELAGDHPTLVAWAGTGSGPALVGEPSVTASGQHIEVSRLSRAGPIWIGVRGVNETLIADLLIDVVQGGLCEDDAFEPNDAPGLAAPLPDPVAGVTSVEAIACFGSEDWFVLTVPAGLRIIAEAEVTDGGGNPLVTSLHIRNTAGNMQLIGGDGSHLAEAAPRTTTTDVYVRVTNSTVGGRPYRLTVRLRPPRPSNDECGGAIGLTNGLTLDGTTAGANDTTASGCGGEGSPDVVYHFTLSAPRAVRIETEGALDTILSLRSSCGDPATEVLCSDVPGDTEVLEAVLPAGTWYVWVDNHEGREGSFRIQMVATDPPPVPENDVCEEARLLDTTEGGGLLEGDVASASDAVTASCGAAGGDALYTLVLDAPASLVADLHGVPGMSVSLRGACEDDGSEEKCAVVPSGAAAHLDLPYLAAGTYTLVVDGGGIPGGAYTLTWGLGSAVPVPVNDDCDAPWPLDLGDGFASVSGNTRSASDAHEAVCAAPGQSGPDVVYYFNLSAPRSLEAILDAEFDGVLDLRGSDCAEAASSLVCSDAYPATVFHPELPAGIYHLIVDGYAGGSGPFVLTVATDAPLPPPENDTCEDAILLDLSEGPAVVEGHTFRATNAIDLGSACTGSSTAGPDVIFAVDLTEGETLVATVVPEVGFDPALYLVGGCEATECLVGADEWFVSEPETIAFTAGTSGRYYLVVDAWRDGEVGRFELTVAIE